MEIGASNVQPVDQGSSVTVPAAAHEQHPYPDIESGSSMSRAVSGSALRAKLAVFTRNRLRVSTWID
jgi:hypothetical protein